MLLVISSSWASRTFASLDGKLARIPARKLLRDCRWWYWPSFNIVEKDSWLTEKASSPWVDKIEQGLLSPFTYTGPLSLTIARFLLRDVSGLGLVVVLDRFWFLSTPVLFLSTPVLLVNGMELHMANVYLMLCQWVPIHLCQSSATNKVVLLSLLGFVS